MLYAPRPVGMGSQGRSPGSGKGPLSPYLAPPDEEEGQSLGLEFLFGPDPHAANYLRRKSPQDSTSIAPP
ncbi:hypothetical protein G5I_12196 [Acromyrmex echinatior]|uniref:Uncharacterized protein n=1 Tax=Acromyrmex echinatior TaxID=103372 RepID=F4X1M9_ACREC|nr:hypothetical protein G5I_12196 [Acromyrmex echinatior]